MPWAGKSASPHIFSLSNLPVQAFLCVSPALKKCAIYSQREANIA